MPNWPDPSTSSENIWYTEAISYTQTICTVTVVFSFTAVTCGLISVLTLAMGENWFLVLPNLFFINIYLTFTQYRSATKIKIPWTKKKGSAASPFVQFKSFNRRFGVKKTVGHNFWFYHNSYFKSTWMRACAGCAGKLCNSVLKKKRGPAHHILLDLAVGHRYADGQLFWREKPTSSFHIQQVRNTT